MRICLLIVLEFLSYQAFAQDSLFRFNALKVSGNKRTKEAVFLRELNIKQGDTINDTAAAAVIFQKRISGLGLFNLVQVHLKQDTIFVVVTERVFTWAMPRLSWADRNFNVWRQTADPARLIYGATVYLNNLGGLNRKAALTIISGYNHWYEMSYQTPLGAYANLATFSLRAVYWNNHELWGKTENNKLQFVHTENKKIQRNTFLETRVKKWLNYYSRWEVIGVAAFNHLDSEGLKANPDYLLNGADQTEGSIYVEYVSDHRDQRDYPLQGYLVRGSLGYSNLFSGHNYRGIPLLQLRMTKFHLLHPRIGLAGGLFGRMAFAELPYNLGRQLGYQNDYVRGYEPYVSDGRGFVLGKLALRYGLLRNRVLNFGDKKPLKNYKKVPTSLWLNIFADAGHVLKPTRIPSNDLARQWQTGIGVGLDIIAWYSNMVRLEYSLNARGEIWFNLSYRNAF